MGIERVCVHQRVGATDNGVYGRDWHRQRCRKWEVKENNKEPLRGDAVKMLALIISSWNNIRRKTELKYFCWTISTDWMQQNPNLNSSFNSGEAINNVFFPLRITAAGTWWDDHLVSPMVIAWCEINSCGSFWFQGLDISFFDWQRMRKLKLEKIMKKGVWPSNSQVLLWGLSAEETI